MTFGKNQNDFAVVPSFKYGRIFGALKAERNGTKVKYSFTQDKEIIDLFDKMVFTRRDHIKPLEDKFTTNGSARYDYVCTLKRMGMWYPEGESGYWGYRDYESCNWVWTTGFPTVDKDLRLDDWAQGGGGSGNSNQNNSDPCANARELANKMTEILNSGDIKTAMQLISNLIQQQIANGQVKENAFAIGMDASGKYHVSPISTATDSNPHSVGYNHFDQSSGITQVGVFHNHTSDNSNSPGDFYELITSNMNYPSYITNFAQNSLGEIFALNIYDRQKAMAFLQKYPKDQNIDGPEFKGTLLADYYRFRSTADWTVNENTNAGQVALVAFLEKLDTGVSLSKRTDTSNFKTFKSSNLSQTVYGGQQQTTYTTTDCN